jgi:D12 class N6 adenine-specific DNA methyltransferase
MDRHKMIDRTVQRAVDSRIMRLSLSSIRHQWSGSSAGSECSLHQLAPYIGKLKTSIAKTLVATYSSPGSTVLEPFSGSGVVGLEAMLQNRNVIANDISPYAAVLTRAKLFAPISEDQATHNAVRYCRQAKRKAEANSWHVDAPAWVRKFFHARTLAETLNLAEILRRREEWFLLACLLGILHHQRPGFLSHPSSHLVPYLRRRMFPRGRYPELYEYRDVEPRLIAKIHRAYRRYRPTAGKNLCRFESQDIRRLRINEPVDLVLTSPPYMNALDYGRDNRLRLWFVGVPDFRVLDQRNCRRLEDFAALIGDLADVVDGCLSPRGKAVLVVGEVRRNSTRVDASTVVKAVFASHRKFRLIDCLEDPVPDIRRSRRNCAGTKREWIMVFARN